MVFLITSEVYVRVVLDKQESYLLLHVVMSVSYFAFDFIDIGSLNASLSLISKHTRQLLLPLASGLKICKLLFFARTWYLLFVDLMRIAMTPNSICILLLAMRLPDSAGTLTGILMVIGFTVFAGGLDRPSTGNAALLTKHGSRSKQN